jgi:hypothetical protein
MAMRYPHRADWKLGESDPYSAQAAWVHAVPVGLLGHLRAGIGNRAAAICRSHSA